MYSPPGGVETAAASSSVCTTPPRVEIFCYSAYGLWKPQQGEAALSLAAGLIVISFRLRHQSVKLPICLWLILACYWKCTLTLSKDIWTYIWKGGAWGDMGQM